MVTARPGMLLTGATGFIGRHVLAAFAGDYKIWALSRDSPSLHGVTLPAGARWLPADVGRPGDVQRVAEVIRREGPPVELVIHLASHYDFTGEPHPEYRRTNVQGMEYVLAASRALGVRDFVFASSLAACDFPPPGEVLDERSPPDGRTPYAESKRAGEELLAGYRDAYRGWIVRFAAVFSDWCEYEPLYRFLETWLTPRLGHRILAGAGRSAVPYLHVRDAMRFLRRLLEVRDELDPAEPLLASPAGATSHRELFEVATSAQFGERARPILVPRPLCRVGLRLRDLAGRAVGSRPWERPWMGRMIDLALRADPARTWERLDWRPRERLSVQRRLPFLVQNRRSRPAEWQCRNHAALKRLRRHENLRILEELRDCESSIADSLVAFVAAAEEGRSFPTLRSLGSDALRADVRGLLRALSLTLRTGEREIFQASCRHLALRRLEEGAPAQELVALLEALSDLSLLALRDVDAGAAWALALQDHVAMTVQLGIDELLDVVDPEPHPAAPALE